MTLQNLPDETLSLWIANKLEPFKALGMATVVVTDEPKPSPLGFWIAREDYEDGDIVKWHPRSMVNDAAMTVMLLEKLLQSAAKQRGAMSLRFHAGQYETYTEMINNWTEAPTLGRAVAEAWAMQNGWKESQ